MSFTFSFSGDDIEDDWSEEPIASSTSIQPTVQNAEEAIPARAQNHKVEDLVGIAS